MKELKQFAPCYTGGAFHLMRDEKHALALNDLKVTLFNLRTNQVLSALEQENEDIGTFALSPNQRYLATANKNFLIRLFEMPDTSLEGFDPAEFKKMECFKMFKTSTQLVVEMTFDPSSKLLAVGTSDSHVKVFDIQRGFQTHNFLGHRGLILKLVFYPDVDSLKLISTGEDF